MASPHGSASSSANDCATIMVLWWKRHRTKVVLLLSGLVLLVATISRDMLFRSDLNMTDAIEVDGEVNKKKTPGYTTKKVTDSPAFKIEYDNCIVGAGLSGSVIAENYASQFGQTSLILEKRHHIAGNCFDYIDEETGILVSLFGAHLFHTKHDRVWGICPTFLRVGTLRTQSVGHGQWENCSYSCDYRYGEYFV